MALFLTANSGLASRFPNQIEFPDYTGAELLAITQSIAKSKGYRLDDACAMPLVAFFDRRQSENAAENGNGRMARNTLEKAILNQSKRLVADADAALDLLLPGGFRTGVIPYGSFPAFLKKALAKDLNGYRINHIS